MSKLAAKVLIVSGLRIYPSLNGGHLRTLNFAKSLARLGHEVQIYCLAGRKQEYKGKRLTKPEHIEERLTQTVNLGLGFGLCQTIARRLSIPRIWQYPLLRLGLIPKSLRDALDWADIIVSDLVFIARVPGPWQSKTWLLLAHNLEHRLLAQGNSWHRYLFAPLCYVLERNIHQKMSGIFACAEDDLRFFQDKSQGSVPCMMVPNGVEPGLYKGSDRQKLRQEMGVKEHETLIVFSGSRYGPNDAAGKKLELFARKHSDWLHEKSIRFVFLGSMKRPKPHPRIISTGFVEEIFPYFQIADLAINPIEWGSGSNVKTFEYLAAHVPFLSLRFGIRGTTLVPDQDFFCFEWHNLLEKLETAWQLVQSGQAKNFASQVWQRHQERCEMQAIVNRAWREMLGGRVSLPEAQHDPA